MSVISRSGIAIGQIIKSEHLLRVIKALDGTDITDIIVTGSLTSNNTIGSFTGSLLGTAATASVLSPGNKTINGDLVVTGKITAEEYHNEFISSSIVYKSGSTKFGDSLDDVHSFTGSLQSPSITGSLLGNASTSTTASYALTASHFSGSVVSSSYSLSSSYALNATNVVSASYSLSSSYALNATNVTSASYSLNSTSASYSLNATNVTSASYALDSTNSINSFQAVSASYAVTASYFSGSISDAISASYALTASYAERAISASYFSGSISNAVSASYAENGGVTQIIPGTNITVTNGGSGSVTINSTGGGTAFPYTGSAEITGSLILTGSAIVTNSITASYFKGDGSALTGIIGEWDGTLDGNGEITGSLIVTNGITGSLSGSATSATSASYALSSSFSTVANSLTSGDKTINGDLIVTGKITAEEFLTEFVSSSIIYQSGSTKFGDTPDDVHSFTGSLQVLGSISGSIQSASYALNSTSASYALTASHFSGSVVSSSYALSASYALNATNVVSASYALNATNAVSSSVAVSSSFARNSTSASYALNGGVTQIIAGTNVTISPTEGTGSVTINATGGGSSVFPIYQVTLNIIGGLIDTAGTPIASVLGPNGESRATLEALGWTFSTPTTSRLNIGRPSGSRVRPLLGIMAHAYNSVAGGFWSKVPTGNSTSGALSALQIGTLGNLTGLNIYGISTANLGYDSSSPTTLVITFELIN
jgi:hypothetical protein